MATSDDTPPIPTPTSEQAAPTVPPVEAPPAAPASPAQGYAQPVSPSPYPGYAAPLPRGLSIASIICGIGGVFLSFFGIGFLPSLAGVITGHLATKRQPHAKPLWLTGIITGYAGIAISIIWTIVVVIIIVVAIAHGSSSGDYTYYNS